MCYNQSIMWFKFWRRFTKFIDPKLEKFREPKKEVKPKYTPTSLEDFIGIIQRTPKSILSAKDRDRIAAVMSFDERTVADLMTDKEKMIYVSDKDFLGPLVLDKLFRSGFTNFPVTDSKGKVKGIIHTEAFNALEIKNTDRVDKYIDKNVNYLHTTDSLKSAIDEINRTNGYYFLVLDEDEELAGFFTTEMLLNYLTR